MLIIMLLPYTYVVLLFCIHLITNSLCNATQRPVIGILSQETHENDAGAYIMAAYVQFLEQAGAAVVPIKIGQDVKHYESLFGSLNGVLLPGGGVRLDQSDYTRVAKLFYKWAFAANLDGDYFPIWATCLGFEALSMFVASANVTSYCYAENLAMPLTYTVHAQHSKLLKDMPSRLLKASKDWPITYNYHHFCVEVSKWNTSKNLSRFFNVLSTNKDLNGTRFISMVEGKSMPFYATQWHPEKNAFVFSISKKINHSAEAIQFTQYLASFFVAETKRNNHTFPSEEIMSRHLIENYSPNFQGYPTYALNYFFTTEPGSLKMLEVPQIDFGPMISKQLCHSKISYCMTNNHFWFASTIASSLLFILLFITRFCHVCDDQLSSNQQLKLHDNASITMINRV